MFLSSRRNAHYILLAVCSCLLGRVPDARAQGLRITDGDVRIIVTSGQTAESWSAHPPLRVAAEIIVRARNPTLREAVLREAAKYDIDPVLVYAMIEQESGGRARAISPKGARGPMQLMPATAARFGVRNPHDVPQAVRGGVEYLVWLLDRFDGNVSLALAGYNAGEAAVEAYRAGRAIILPNGRVINPLRLRTGGIPPYAETRSYVRSIAIRYTRMRSNNNRLKSQGDF